MNPHLPFVGIATMAGSLFVSLDDKWEADAAFLGIPYDFGVGYRPGARFAPRAIRDVSTRYRLTPEGFWLGHPDITLFRGKKLVDCGDSNIAQLEYQESFAAITADVRKILAHNSLPVVIGGDHSITYPVVRAFSDQDPFHILHFDAHLDYTEQRSGTLFSNSSPLRRAVELGCVKSILTVGARGLRTDKQVYEDAINRGHTILWARDVMEKGIEMVFPFIQKGERYYVTFDIDVLDPSIACGTSSPEQGGLSFYAALDLLRYAAGHTQVIGFDFVEVCPELDHSKQTALLSAHLILEFVGWCLLQRGSL